MRVLGVDGAKGGWVVVALDDGAFADAWAVRSIAGLDADEASIIAVDTPIGEPPGVIRAADRAARRFLPGKAATVCNPVPVAALSCSSREDADQVSRRLTSKGVSPYSWGLRAYMADARAPWADDPARIREAHPECSFCAMNGSPVLAKKTTPSGMRERAQLLGDNGIHLDFVRCAGLPPVDVVDAAAAAWTAHRIASGTAVSLPDPPERDSDGRPVAIWV